MQQRDERELREELVSLRAEHRRLDCEIVALEGNPSADQLLIKRLKKKKLAVKDRITQIEGSDWLWRSSSLCESAMGTITCR
jgi:hypothetical protein